MASVKASETACVVDQGNLRYTRAEQAVRYDMVS